MEGFTAPSDLFLPGSGLRRAYGHQTALLVSPQPGHCFVYAGERVPAQQRCSSLALTLAEMFLRLANAESDLRKIH